MDKRIGAQLYTVRDFCQTESDFDESLAKIKEIGYKTVQVSGIGQISAEKVRSTADKYGLEIVCTHTPRTELEQNLDEVIYNHEVMGCKIIGLGGAFGFASFEEFVKLYNPIAEKIKKAGFQFTYHNHAFEFARYGSGCIMDYLLENTDAECFKFILDVYWLAVAGIVPQDFITEHAERMAAIHFKDLTVEDNNAAMTEVMEGNLNWDKIIAASEKSSARYALVEQDICKRNPFESLKISYDNLTKKGFC